MEVNRGSVVGEEDRHDKWNILIREAKVHHLAGSKYLIHLGAICDFTFLAAHGRMRVSLHCLSPFFFRFIL
jgi:hypothetical protein